MAKEHAERLVKDLEDDPALKEKVSKVAQQTLNLIREHGYDVTEDEVREALGQRLGVTIPKTTDGEDGSDPMTCFIMSEAPGR